MKANYELCLSGSSCIFVPYRPEHLPNYHEWMQDPHLLEATASEPLTMDEEVEMQREWRDDENKCTFIILARDLLPEGGNSEGVVPPPPPPAAESEELGTREGGKEEGSYPNLVARTLDAMIGDVNLFLSDEEPGEGSDDERNEQISESTPDNPKRQAELDLMIAVSSHRNKNLGAELALTMMHYGARYLRIRRFFVKIKDTNHASLRLFSEKLGFAQCAYAKCFGEYELECRCETPEEMTEWVEKRWRRRCQQKKNDADAGGCHGDDDRGGRPRGLYDVYECPLISSA